MPDFFKKSVLALTALAVLTAAGCQLSDWRLLWGRRGEPVVGVKIVWQVTGQGTRDFRYQVGCDFTTEKKESPFSANLYYQSTEGQCLLGDYTLNDAEGQREKLALDDQERYFRMIQKGESYNVYFEYGELTTVSGQPLPCEPRLEDFPVFLVPVTIIDRGSDFDGGFDDRLVDFGQCQEVEVNMDFQIIHRPSSEASAQE